jgi:hypothetical protein
MALGGARFDGTRAELTILIPSFVIPTWLFSAPHPYPETKAVCICTFRRTDPALCHAHMTALSLSPPHPYPRLKWLVFVPFRSRGGPAVLQNVEEIRLGKEKEVGGKDDTLGERMKWGRCMPSDGDVGTTICDASRVYGNAAHAAVYLSLLIVFPTCPQHHLRVSQPLFLGISILKRISPSWGAPAPFHYPPAHLKRPRLRST